MFSSDFDIKIIDFGLSDLTQFSSELKGSLDYASPELLAEVEHDTSADDVFALGVIIFNMKTGFRPFMRADLDDELYYTIGNYNFERFW